MPYSGDGGTHITRINSDFRDPNLAHVINARILTAVDLYIH